MTLCYAERPVQHCAVVAVETSPQLVTSGVTRTLTYREESYTDTATQSWAEPQPFQQTLFEVG